MTKGWLLSEDKSELLFYSFENQNFNKNPSYTVVSSALNHRDLWITKGKYPSIKAGVVLGSDGCIIYDDLYYILNPSLNWGGDQKVQSLAYTVLGMPTFGTFATEIAIDSSQLTPKPPHLDVFQAAALPLAGLTAYRALIVKCMPLAGEKVLISGIGGGVALFSLQFALALGCEVYVTSSSGQKLDKAIKLGAKKGYNYMDSTWTKQLMADIGGVDIVIDSAGGESFNDLVKVTNPGGRIAFYGGSNGLINGLNPQTIFWRQISLYGSTMGSDADFIAMIDFVNRYQIVPVVDEILPLSALKHGLEKMNNKEQFGKIVFEHNDCN